MTTPPTNVVYDINVLVAAGAGGSSPFRSWPSPPPTSGNPAADCVGVIADAAEFALWLSPHILDHVERFGVEVLKWDSSDAELYVTKLVELAYHSEGGVIDPPRQVHDCPDFEDNLILDLAAEVGAFIVVSNDTDLLSMSPWRGTPVLTPRDFASKVDGMRRHARRGRG